MKLKDILNTQESIRNMGYGIENNVIEHIDVNIIAHFGNSVCLEVLCSNICPYSTHNNTSNMGYLIRAIIELLGLEQEDGVRLSTIREIPCRLVYESSSNGHWGEKALGIGHFMKDKFVLFSDFSKIDQ